MRLRRHITPGRGRRNETPDGLRTHGITKVRLARYLHYKVKEAEAVAPVDIEGESTAPATVLSFWGFVG